LVVALGIAAWQLGGTREASPPVVEREERVLESDLVPATKAPPECSRNEHLSGDHRCPSGEEWVEARGRCLCLDKSLCGSGSRPLFEVKAPGEWVVIRPGSFLMGAPGSEAGRDNDEVQHRVTLTRDFMLQATEVTQGQWRQVMGNNPSRFQGCGPNCPVEQVSWYDSLAYCNALSLIDGLAECYDLSACTGTPGGGSYTCPTSKIGWRRGLDCVGYRLPTEAEWEYSARAGTTEATYNGDLESTKLECQRGNNALNPIGWFCGNSEVSYSGSENCTSWGGFRRCGSQPVKQKRPNAWGLYDMLGNVWEWNWDRFVVYPTGDVTDPVQRRKGSNRVMRGGSWLGNARYVRAGARYGFGPGNRYLYLGLRPARSLPGVGR
jgi:formylglycine-generating enzyme required for sulfatase activity